MAIVRLGQLHAENRNTSEYLTEAVGGSQNASIDTVPRTGSFSYLFSGTDRPIGLGFSSVSQFWAGAWLKHNGVSDNPTNIVALFRFFGTPMRYVHYVYPDNLIELSVNGNVLQVDAHSMGFLRQMVWMHVGIHFKADPTTGFLTFYLDGRNVISFVGDTTGDVTTLYFGGVPASSNFWTNAWFDDFYVESTVGEVDSPPPPKRFLFSLPNAAGINTEWAPTGAAINYQTVDEAPPDNDTSYVESATVGVTDSYNVASFTLPVHWEDIPAAMPYVWAKQLNGDASIDSHLYDGVYEVGSTHNLDTDYESYFDRMVAQPGGGDWDQASVDAIQMGMDRVA